jgi:2-phosphosulfolactate phosphatase
VAPQERDDLRPGIEDWAGAGAIAAALRDAGLSLSVEAQAATLLADAVDLAACVSARELVAAGFAADVELCLARDVTDAVPVGDGRAFTAFRTGDRPRRPGPGR